MVPGQVGKCKPGSAQGDSTGEELPIKHLSSESLLPQSPGLGAKKKELAPSPCHELSPYRQAMYMTSETDRGQNDQGELRLTLEA